MTGLLVLLALLALLAARVPVAVALALVTAGGLLQHVPPVPALATVAQRIATGLDSFTLLAIPLFILAGEIMARGGIAKRLIDFARLLPGGLGRAHVVASMLFGAISGSAVAAASAIGGVLGPRLQEEGHSRGAAAAINISASTTGLVIPPSNVLIVYSLASGGVSIAALFLAGYGPGLLVGLLLMAVAGAGGRTPGGRPAFGRAFARALPGLGLPVAVIGGILLGVFTATEASGVAVAYALVLALATRELRPAEIPDVLVRAATTTGTVMLLVGTSIALSWLLSYERIPQQLSTALLSFADSPLALLLGINLLLLGVGTFMDITPAVLIFTPIFLPVATELGIHPVHFGIVIVLNLCIGLCTPPVGTVLFVGCGVAGAGIREVIRPLVPMYAAMLLALAVVTAWPPLSLALPRWLGYVEP